MLPEPEDEIFDDLCFRIENEVVDRLNVSMTSSHLDEVLGNGPVREPAVPPVVSVNSTSSGPTASSTRTGDPCGAQSVPHWSDSSASNIGSSSGDTSGSDSSYFLLGRIASSSTDSGTSAGSSALAPHCPSLPPSPQVPGITGNADVLVDPLANVSIDTVIVISDSDSVVSVVEVHGPVVAGLPVNNDAGWAVAPVKAGIFLC